jgi:hypothetical protein
MIKFFITNNRGRKKEINLYNLNYSLIASKKLSFLSYSNLFFNCHTNLRQDEITKNLVIA